MTQEEKEFLLKDICARLPYGVMVRVEVNDVFITPTDEVATVNTINMLDYPQKFRITPYLRPMSSMTEEEENEYKMFIDYSYNDFTSESFPCVYVDKINDYLDWLNARQFDYRGLIPMGLALPATEGMYNIK